MHDICIKYFVIFQGIFFIYNGDMDTGDVSLCQTKKE